MQVNKRTTGLSSQRGP